MSWMAWTLPTALFFAAIGVLLATLGWAERRRPTTLRKGWLPMATTRGDRVFASLLGAAFIHATWLGVTDVNVVGATVLSSGWAFATMRFG